MLRFDLDKLLTLVDGMPLAYCLLSDSSRVLVLDMLSRIERWQWRYENLNLTDEQWDEAQAIVDLATKEVITIMLTGTILLWPSGEIPEGFALCDGSEISRTEYADLFDLIGETFGPGNGTSTFNVPDLRGKTAVGLDEAQGEFDVMGETGGEKTHQLTPSEMPIHNHQEGVSNPTLINGGLEAPAASAIPSVAYTGSAGGDMPHNNLQPYIVLNYIIKL
jgi:microcystin-dependent protein